MLFTSPALQASDPPGLHLAVTPPLQGRLEETPSVFVSSEAGVLTVEGNSGPAGGRTGAREGLLPEPCGERQPHRLHKALRMVPPDGASTGEGDQHQKGSDVERNVPQFTSKERFLGDNNGRYTFFLDQYEEKFPFGVLKSNEPCFYYGDKTNAER